MPEEETDLVELLRAFSKSSFATLEVAQEGTRIFVRRALKRNGTAASVGPATARQDAAGSEAPWDVQESRSLTAPRVGRFFHLQDAHGNPMLKAGIRVAQGQVYGIIESMHLRYEIRSEHEGVIDRVLVPSGEAVEFGQPLVLLQT